MMESFQLLLFEDIETLGSCLLSGAVQPATIQTVRAGGYQMVSPVKQTRGCSLHIGYKTGRAVNQDCLRLRNLKRGGFPCILC